MEILQIAVCAAVYSTINIYIHITIATFIHSSSSITYNDKYIYNNSGNIYTVTATFEIAATALANSGSNIHIKAVATSHTVTAAFTNSGSSLCTQWQ